MIFMDTNPVLRLKLLRTHENLTQRQMAAILEVGQNTYSRMENGVTSFKDSYKKILEEKPYHRVAIRSGCPDD